MRRASIASGLVLLILVGFSVSVSAQNPTLTSIQNTLNGLVNTVNGLVQSVNAIAVAVVPGNVLVTSAATPGSDHNIGCTVANISASSRNVTLEAFRVSDGQNVLTTTENLLPRSGTGHLFDPDFAYCKFTVNNSTKNDVRANLIIQEGGGAFVVVADAK